MNDREKSDTPVVPTKAPNKATKVEAEEPEGRGVTKGNSSGQNTRRTQSRASVTSALARVREVARRDRKVKFTALLHHVTVERLTKAYQIQGKHAAAGVDGMTWDAYGVKLGEKILDLHDRIQRGAYKPQATRRVYIPKSDGGRRPLGIATIEDKIVQGAVAEVLNAIYEEDFFGFCYGFRKRRSQHDALDALTVGLMRKRVNWIVDADIQSFFDKMGHEWMRRFLEHRIADQRMVRLILRWLKAGVMEDGTWTQSESGSPQGATISPLLANLYLYYVFDQWVHHWRKTKAHGDMVIVRYADDFVVGFEHRSDAEEFLGMLGVRLEKFELTLHPNKTRLIEFGRYAAERRERRGAAKPESFTFLGFAHICIRPEKGKPFLRRITESKRMTRKLAAIREELKRRRHDPIPEQGQWLSSVIRGFDAYYGIPGNSDALDAYRHALLRLWQQSLRRRSQKHHLTKARMIRLERRWFPKAKISHLWPETRFDAKHPR